MKKQIPTVLVAGHICLDVIPHFPTSGDKKVALVPGRLLQVGAAALSTGGAVPNVGVALHRLGVPVELAAKVGDDGFGAEILTLLKKQDKQLVRGIRVEKSGHSQQSGGVTSYTIVLSPPGMDRIFLHCPGANDTFTAADVSAAALKRAGLMHFGYPPVMRKMYEKGGGELARLFKQAKRTGVTTSLDLAFPDLQSEAGQVDWCEIFQRVLPSVDIFLPSIEELVIMLQRERYLSALKKYGDFVIARDVNSTLLRELSDRLLHMGVGVVVIKLGDQGIYVRSVPQGKRWKNMGRILADSGVTNGGVEILVPCYRVKVAGTTGSGDCTIAGFLAALARGYAVPEAAQIAVAVGACNVEQTDATSGIPSWEKLQQRLRGAWGRLPVGIKLTDWEEHNDSWESGK